MASGPVTATIAIAVGLTVLVLPSPVTHVLAILVAGALGALVLRPAPEQERERDSDALRQVSARAAYLCLTVFFALLVGLFLLATLDVAAWLNRAAAYFQAGALVFGGGHVVLPLLEQLTVAPGWVSQAEFLTGYSVAQAVPGPLFTFAAYLGAVDAGIPGAILATIAIFLPAALLIIAGMHFWDRWRAIPWLRRGLTGVNAAVVGLLGAAFYDPVLTHGITGLASLGIAAVCWLGLAKWKLPPWSIAAGAAMAGLLLL